MSYTFTKIITAMGGGCLISQAVINYQEKLLAASVWCGTIGILLSVSSFLIKR